MTRFSISAALSAGLDLIRRRPLAVVVWGLIAVLPSVLLVPLMIPMMSHFGETAAIASGSDAQADAAASQLMQQMRLLQSFNLLVNLVQFVAFNIVYTAVMRSILRGDQTARFSVRFGMDEVRTAVVCLVIVLGSYAAVLLAAILIGLIGAIAYLLTPVAAWVAAPLGFAAVIAIFVASGRATLMLPMTFDTGEFAFAEGWSLGRSQTGRLALLTLAIIAIGLAALVVFVGLYFAVAWFNGLSEFVAAMRPAFTGEGFNPAAALNAYFRQVWPVWLLFAGPTFAIYGALTAFSMGSYADAYRQLRAASPPVATAT